jgi:Rad3-related DNA helicase
MLSNKQKEVLNICKENILKGMIHLHELPTGFGKSTYLLPYLAIDLHKKKKVIISTSTNFLANKLFSNLKEKFPLINIGIVIGAENYLDLKKIDNDFYGYFVYPHSVMEYIKKLKKNITFDELYRDCLINDDDQDIVSDIYHADNREDLNDVSVYDVSITNHVFLLLLKYNKSIDLSDYFILSDEVHEIYDAQKLISESSFSISRFKVSLKRIISKSVIDRETKMYLGKIYKDSCDMLNKYKDENKIDMYITDKQYFKEYINELISFASKRKKLVKIIEKLKGDKYAKIFLREYNELKDITNGNGELSLYFSKTKGYPTLHYRRQNIQAGLYVFFKNLSGFVGVSGTLYTVPPETNKKDFKGNAKIDGTSYIINKLGINSLKDKVIIKYTSRIFPIDNIKIHTEYLFAKKNDDSDGEILDNEWIENIAKLIAKTHNYKNSMVIMGSYGEVKALHEILVKFLLDVNIVKADYTTTQMQTINKFKSEGGILIGTRTYAKGIDLPGKELENLYIPKLLFPPINDKSMLDKKAFSAGYYWDDVYNDMLFMLRQSLGRLQRRPDDKGDIYIFDNRINSTRVKPKVERIFKTIGKLI